MRDRYKLETTLDRYWPPEDVIMTCTECGETLYRWSENDHPISGASYVAIFLTVVAEKHQEKMGKLAGVDINIIPQPHTVNKRIDCEITVGDSEVGE
jgi:hypothetical protein